MSDHDRLVESELGHPGFEWLNDAACLPLAEGLEAEGKNPMSLFFRPRGTSVQPLALRTIMVS
jgi:hypothetical protein